jgi:hypothetical protein
MSDKFLPDDETDGTATYLVKARQSPIASDDKVEAFWRRRGVV